MAESPQHQWLVSRIVNAVSEVLNGCNEALCFVDGTSNSDGAPRRISGFRPDVYATGASIVIVGEAKPVWDVESSRTEFQLRAFLEHVEAHPSRHLVLAVHWTAAATAKSILRNITSNWAAVRERVHILDGVCPLIIPGKETNNASGA